MNSGGAPHSHAKWIGRYPSGLAFAALLGFDASFLVALDQFLILISVLRGSIIDMVSLMTSIKEGGVSAPLTTFAKRMVSPMYDV